LRYSRYGKLSNAKTDCARDVDRSRDVVFGFDRLALRPHRRRGLPTSGTEQGRHATCSSSNGRPQRTCNGAGKRTK